MNDFSKCEPVDISLKTFFLGPQAENRDWVMGAVQYLFEQWFQWRQNYFPLDGEAISSENRYQSEFIDKQKELMNHLKTLIRRFEDEVPKFSPRYMGHMFSEQSLPALLGHILTLLHNPNNVSGEASKVGIKIEREAIEDLCMMVGWHRQESIGHFTSGGTIANFEGLLRAKNRLYQWLALGTYLRERGLTQKGLFELSLMGWEEFDRWILEIDAQQFSQWKQDWLSNPIRFASLVSRVFGVNFEGPVVLVSQSKHYSWPKGTQLLGLGSDRLISINLDSQGRMDVQHLKQTIELCRQKNLPVCCVVSVAGTTEMGTVDPIDEVQSVLAGFQQNGFNLWHHVDAAYGGFLCAMRGMQGDHDVADLLVKLDAISGANSITIDPHKLGYVPYASGVILVKSRREYSYQEIHAPYIQFDTTKDVGLQTLEGSRSAAGAVATWLTERSIGLNANGYGRILNRTIAVRKLVQSLLARTDSRFLIPKGLDTNVLCLTVASRGESLSDINNRVTAIYDKLAPGRGAPFIISKTSLQFSNYQNLLDPWLFENDIKKTADKVDLLRLCLMNPFIVSKETNVSYPEALVSVLKSVSDQV